MSSLDRRPSHLIVTIFFQEAKEKFQLLQKVMLVLGDEEKRALYDQTGIVDDNVSFLETSFQDFFGELRLQKFFGDNVRLVFLFALVTIKQDLVGAGSDELQEFFRATYKKVHLSFFLSFFKNKMPLIFPYNQVTEADIEEFEANYRGSESEDKDLKDLYKRFKGNMNRYRLLYFHDFFF